MSITSPTTSPHQRQDSHQLRPFILLPDYVTDLPDDLILHLVHLPLHHLGTLVGHLVTLVGNLATPVSHLATDPTLWSNRHQQDGNLMCHQPTYLFTGQVLEMRTHPKSWQTVLNRWLPEVECVFPLRALGL